MSILTAVFSNSADRIITTYDDGRPIQDVPNFAGNRDRKEIAAWEALSNTITPFVALPDTRSARQKCHARYIEELSPEGTFETSIVDMFDAMVKALNGDMMDFNKLVVKMDKIRSDLL